MIVIALIILLVILIISNFAVGIFNKMVPPCSADNEYFQNAKRLPDDAVIGLGSIPSHAGFDYVGAATVATGTPGVIGLTSYPSLQKNGYMDLSTNGTIEGYLNNMSVTEEDPSDCDISCKASNAIDNILQTGKKYNSNSDGVMISSTKAGSLNEFEVSMKDILSKNNNQKKNRKNHASLAHSSERDGYCS